MNKTAVQKLFQLTCIRNYSYKSVRRPDSAAFGRKPKVEVAATAAGDVPPLSDNKSVSHTLSTQLRAKIMATGPITVAEYMREVLTNPLAGYYITKRDVFGRDGDFITSPEISQIFGELVAVWVLSEWRKVSSPSPFQIIELGPGRGTLARDILKVLTQFKLGGQFSMHLVEISPNLSQIQAQRFCYSHKLCEDDALPYYQTGKTASGTDVFWYKRLEDVPHGFSIVLANEFFDALPVHKLQLDDAGAWKEILIDVDVTRGTTAAEQDFRFVISKAQTPISQLYRPSADETRACLEYSLEADRIVAMLAERFERDGGIGLIMDYGHFGEKTDTFRAFKRHKLHDPLKEPGTADLTADVDFRQMQRTAEQHGQVLCYGPVEQGDFLQKLEGATRLEQLLQNALPENQNTIKTGYKMLTDPKQMGKRFKFFAMFPAVLKEHLAKFPINGFT